MAVGPAARATTVDWSVTDAHRAAFADLSGDHNPIHVDPIAARRLQGGRMLVHGAHLVLCVLDQSVELGWLESVPALINARFRHGVAPGMPLTTTFGSTAQAPERLEARVVADVRGAIDVTIVPGGAGPFVAGSFAAVSGAAVSGDAVSTPDDVAFDALPGLAGAFEVRVASQELTTRFPNAVSVLGTGRVAEIAHLSRVVGMHAPGLRSMSSTYRITVDGAADTERSPALRYAVLATDERVRRVDLEVSGSTLSARIVAFSPLGPVDQFEEADGDRPAPDEFTGRRVLVVGGSRGLGAATVRLLVAGGADARFTFRVGDVEAAEVSARLDVTAARFDTSDGAPGVDRVCSDGWQPDTLCWFATPPYRDGTALARSAWHEDELRAIQIDAFVGVVDHLRGRSEALRAALWPSADVTTGELATVKRLGEEVAADLARRHPGLVVSAPRLPTMLTDQTRSLLPTEYANTAATLLAVLRLLLTEREFPG